MASARPDGIGLVVFDWAGTLSDHGSLAPVLAFREVFARHGVEVTTAQARAPMGLGKREHIAAMLQMPEVARMWHARHGRPPGPSDIEALYEHFKPAQLAAIELQADLIDGALQAVAELRDRGIPVATTTGYFREAAGAVLEAARAQGLHTDHDVCADDVSAGRPAPFMIYACMEALNVYPASRVVVVGDTAADMRAGVNAGCVCVGLARTGNEVGLSAADWAALSAQEQGERLLHARTALHRAGADFVIETLHGLSQVLEAVARRASVSRSRVDAEPARFERLLPSRAIAPRTSFGESNP